MLTKILPYRADSTECQGYLAYTETQKDKRPGILIAHAWMGQDNFARQKAEDLASLGYIALAADVYGDGRTAKDAQAALELMQPLFRERKLLRQRIVAAYNALQAHPLVDKDRIGAIGFCFGGLTVVELMRSGVPLCAVVAFHGLYGDTIGDLKAIKEPNASKLLGAFLALHGFDDPLVKTEEIEAFQKELTEAGVDWQWHTYGNTAHAFTNPEANLPSMGIIYNAKSEKRAWHEMIDFFQETLHYHLGEKL